MWRFVLALNSAESTHLSLMARGWVVSSFKRQIRRIVLSRGIAFQRTNASMNLIDSTLENNFRRWSSNSGINSIHGPLCHDANERTGSKPATCVNHRLRRPTYTSVYYIFVVVNSSDKKYSGLHRTNCKSSGHVSWQVTL